jgi:protein SCO1/2
MKQLLKRLSLILLSLGASNWANAGSVPDLGDIAYQQKPGAPLPLRSMFRDEKDRAIRLSEIFEGAPVVLVLGYFHCANLCSVLRGNVLNALQESELIAGRDYGFVALSVDPQDTSVTAAKAKAGDLERFPTTGAEKHWRYLTGENGSARALAEVVGYVDRYDGERNAFLHPVGVVFLRPDGVVSNYLLGLGYRGNDMRRAVARAASGEIAPAASPVLLLCFDFDSTTGRYTLAIIKLLRLAAVTTVVVIGLALFRAVRREGAGA